MRLREGDGHSSAEVTDASGTLWLRLLEEMGTVQLRSLMRLGRFGAAAGGDGHSSAEVTDASGTLWCGCWRRWAQFS